MFRNIRNNITQQINNLNYAIQSYNLNQLKAALDEANRRFWLSEIVLAEYLTISNTLPAMTRPLQYEDYISIANTYIEILQSELSYLQDAYMGYTKFSQRAINQLYNNQGCFTPTQVIYKKNGQLLTVSNVLSVVGYTQKAIETIGVKIDGKYNIALLVLNTINLALNNRRQDKPLNKALHLTNDVLLEVTKKVIDDERVGQVISGTSLLFDLTIDFLMKE
ncbi:MAG: hypothetical protein FWD90_14175 [Defluviitaleaceae bacterium]|nr:hypothetical protein [Defluviitaleaceae bacterium]